MATSPERLRGRIYHVSAPKHRNDRRIILAKTVHCAAKCPGLRGGETVTFTGGTLLSLLEECPICFHTWETEGD